LVSADTIEGQIYLLLEEKLLEIAKTLGKVDELGQIAEDLRGQILGQLSERISYDKLYQDAVRDPKLVRTRQELQVAIENAQTARQVVWELFQELDTFRLDDYKKMDDAGVGMARLRRFVQEAVSQNGGAWRDLGDEQFEISGLGDSAVQLTSDREIAKGDEKLALLGLEHPLVRTLLESGRALSGPQRGLVASVATACGGHKGLLTVWHVVLQDTDQKMTQRILPLGVDREKNRNRPIEKTYDSLSTLHPGSESLFDRVERAELLTSTLPDLLRRDLEHRGYLSGSTHLSARLLAWVEFN
jgi:hypothetical protein